MRNNRRPLVTCGLLLLSCIVSIVCARILFTAPIPRGGAVNLNDLLLDVSSLPPYTEVWEGPSRLPRDPSLDLNSEDNLSIFFELPGSSRPSSHFLYKFPNTLSSWWAYGSALRFAFYDPSRYNWKTPDGWSYKSPNADDFNFKCAEIESYTTPNPSMFTRCSALARYGEIISEFSTPLVPKVMELDDVERILREIDEHMANQLK